MRINRFLLSSGLEAIHDSEQIHQIKNVFRLKENDRILGINGGREYILKINNISKNEICLNLLEELPFDEKRELKKKIKVCFPLLKGEKTDWVLQKCTELGAHEFQFVDFAHSVKQPGNLENKFKRWQKIIIEAVEQSERLLLPILKEPIGLSEICLTENEFGLAFIERLGAEANKEISKELFADKEKITLIFGPEGGFSGTEKELLIQKGFRAQSLGKRILRAETAIILGTGLVSLYSS